jgi:murein DD-endopeptidase MepM/ murein hydrolase activator NlpD
MAKIHYRYNSETCKYEPILHTRKQILNKTLRFMLFAFLIGLTGFMYLNFNYLPYDEITLKQENTKLKMEWQLLQNKITQTANSLAKLEHEDDNYYRVVLDLEKLDKTIRNGGAGGSQKYELGEDRKVTEIASAYEDLNKISSRIEVESQSLNEIGNRVARLEDMKVTRPAMQPIDNRQLTRFNTIFGMRKHPIHGDWRNHNGLDLTADMGTPVYATGDGVVVLAKYNGGYGNVIFLSHGYGFESRYAHLSKFKVVPGQRVKRGELIGLVGNTGLSTNSHLHYEVLYNNKWINPIYFMYRDLSQAEYNELLKEAKDPVFNELIKGDDATKIDRSH